MLNQLFFLVKMRKLVLLCACLSIAIGVNAQTNTRKAKKD